MWSVLSGIHNRMDNTPGAAGLRLNSSSLNSKTLGSPLERGVDSLLALRYENGASQSNASMKGIFLVLFVVIWLLAVVIFGSDPRPSQQVASRIARKAGWLGALLGLLVSLVSMAALYLFQPTPDAGDWLVWIWPSSLGLMGLENRPSAVGVVEIYLVAIGFNVVLYAGITWSGAFIYAQIFRRAAQ